ncbi:aldose epimerase family protein [Deinococcus budaensis]|uniref:Aldose 1-epimerase n=1 Tax=Deinococcus budaensis TaxID=1665626 RepID=A0A7W8LQE9_9DEIO|nr:aldose epimerase family protein [Deinococcus budaensis]MBB5234547.1 aldose 1-epimerase [Deinococcus budaensis]
MSGHEREGAGTATQQFWGRAPEGEDVQRCTLSLPGGLRAELSSYGAVLVRLLAPDREGRLEDVVLGHDTLEPYTDRARSPYFGATVGRCANRIAHGRFSLRGRSYALAQNNGPNALHGGERGFDQRVWASRVFVGPDGPAAEFTRFSPDGEEGYPGTLAVQVTYTLTAQRALQIDYQALTDAPTPVNLTHHSYWNLTGDPRRTILDHELTVFADQITPVGASLIPTGAFQEVAGTPFDFRLPRRVGEQIGADDEQLRVAGGYDHNFVLRGGTELKPAATLHDPVSGRELRVLTTEPGLQVYSGNFLDGTVRGKGGAAYGHRSALCLEPQHFPDSPNQPHFPSVILDPGQRLTSRTVYAFGIR